MPELLHINTQTLFYLHKLAFTHILFDIT